MTTPLINQIVLDAVYHHVAAGEHEVATDALFDLMDDLMLDGAWEAFDNVLEQMDLERLDTNLLVAALSMLPKDHNFCETQPQHRAVHADFEQQVVARLRVLAPDRVEGLLRGLTHGFRADSAEALATALTKKLILVCPSCGLEPAGHQELARVGICRSLTPEEETP